MGKVPKWKSERVLLGPSARATTEAAPTDGVTTSSIIGRMRNAHDITK